MPNARKNTPQDMRAKTGHKDRDSEWNHSRCLILTLGLVETKVGFRQRRNWRITERGQ